MNKSSLIRSTIIILVTTTLLLAGYYFLYLKPKLELPNKLLQTEKTLMVHLANLTENRIAYVELTQLDPNTATFKLDSSNLVGAIEKTQKEGLELITEKNSIPAVEAIKQDDFQKLLEETKSIYAQQEELMKKVLATEKYKDAVAVLKSEESIKLLTSETNLILEYQFWLEKISKFQSGSKK